MIGHPRGERLVLARAIRRRFAASTILHVSNGTERYEQALALYAPILAGPQIPNTLGDHPQHTQQHGFSLRRSRKLQRGAGIIHAGEQR